jgi:bacterioferritin-associated ferredoxin
MYVCVCKAVSDQDIRRAVAQGADSFAELQARTGCATRCGCCEQAARECFEANRASACRAAALPAAA